MFNNLIVVTVWNFFQNTDVLTVVVTETGKLSHVKEVGDIIVHFDENGKPLFMEILKAGKIISLMVQALAAKEVIAI